MLDDLEAAFFTPDQLALLRNFVSQRGGGLLMLGGPDSFADGKYDRTPVGELLPVYLIAVDLTVKTRRSIAWCSRAKAGCSPGSGSRKTEDEERKRLAAMPAFQTLSRAGDIKPGAVVLAEVVDRAGTRSPALVAQQFGKGHVAALLIGDLWRWGMRRDDPAESDLDRSWRQTVRWLVGDVPGRVEVSVRPRADSTTPAVELAVRVRDAEYRPLDNAKVTLRITLPDGSDLALEPSRTGVKPACTRRRTSPSSRVPTESSRPRRPRTEAPSASAKPAGRHSPRPTSSPAWSPTGSS